MFTWLMHRHVRRLERRYGYDASYMHELIEISPEAFRRFGKMQMAGGTFRGDAPVNAWCAAGIAGALIEDCGPCVQIGADMAVEAGVKPEVIAALLSGTPTDADAQLGFDYGRALLNGADTLDALRETIEKRWSKKALIALSLRAMSGRNYPVLKRAMGHAKLCQRVRVGDTDIVVNPVLKAA